MFITSAFVIISGCETSKNIYDTTVTISDTAVNVTGVTEISSTYLTDSSNPAAAGNSIQEKSIPALNNIILLQTTGNTYYVNNNRDIDFTYEYGKYYSVFTFDSDAVDSNYTVFVSEQKTAVAYIPSDGKSIQIKYSDDMGKIWNTSAPILPSLDYYSCTGRDFTSFSGFWYSFFIDFPTQDCGYILIGVSTTMFQQNTRVMFKTTDGGKTWNYLDSKIKYGGPPIENMYFTNKNTGYLCSFYDPIYGGQSSYIQRTLDGGVTWTEYNEIYLDVPEKYSLQDGNPYWNEYPCMPYFIDKTGYLPLIVRGADPITVWPPTQITSSTLSIVIFYTSDDNGVTWVYNPEWDTPISDYINPATILPGCSELLSEADYTDISDSDNSDGIQPTPYFDVLWQTTGNTYTVSDDRKFDFSYEYGRYTSTLLLDKGLRYSNAASVSLQKTAVAYIPFDGKSIQIKYSDDMGKTWNDSEPILPSPDYFINDTAIKDFSLLFLYIDFPTQNCGYIIMAGDQFMMSDHIWGIFKTTDGGKTWTYIKSNLGGYSMCGMRFTDENTGYLCSYCGASTWSYVQRTTDGGVTWTDYDASKLNIPEKYSRYDGKPYYSTIPCRPYFIGKTGYLPVEVQSFEISSMIIFYKSDDNGVMWIYNPEWDTPLSDYANPVALPGCSEPPIINGN